MTPPSLARRLGFAAAVIAAGAAGAVVGCVAWPFDALRRALVPDDALRGQR